MEDYKFNPNSLVDLVTGFFNNRIVQLMLALTWARLMFPDWVEAVGYEALKPFFGL